MNAADISGAVASVLTMVFAWPQAFLALRTGETGGISPGSVALLLTSGLLWSCYGLLTGSAFIAAANLSVSLAAIVTAWASAGRQRRLVVLLGPAAVTALASLAGASVVGLAGVVAGGLMTVPQAVTTLRGRTSLEGVSAASQALLATNAVCWVIHGLAISDPLVVAPNCVVLPAALLILWRRLRATR
jgi:uncharacterized protein with PQ loop repeat